MSSAELRIAFAALGDSSCAGPPARLPVIRVAEDSVSQASRSFLPAALPAEDAGGSARGQVPAVACPSWKGFLLHLHEALATFGEEGNPDTRKRATVLGAHQNFGPTDPIELSSAPMSIFTVSLMVRFGTC